MAEPMRVLMVGAGGVGDAAARIAVERDFFAAWVVADYDVARAERTVAAARDRRTGDDRFSAAQVDASDAEAVAALAREVRATHVFNAVDPRFVMPLFTGALGATDVVVGDDPGLEEVALDRDPGRGVADASGPDHQDAHGFSHSVSPSGRGWVSS